MKFIDKTPFQDASGNVGIAGRLQGTLKYGPNWFPELEAQRSVINQLNRLLDKGFVLIRNFNLPGSDIFIPIILIGPGSLTVIFVTAVKGHFEAKENEWNEVKNGVPTPARRNLIDLLGKLTRAFQKYLQINDIKIPIQVDSVLIAADPGAIVESSRPAVRVVRSDAIKQFVSTLNQSSPVLRAEQVLFSADLILEPQPKSKETPPEPAIPVERPVSRAQAIFKAGESANAPTEEKPAPKTAKKKQPALKGWQIILLAVLGITACCIVGVAVYFASTLLVS